MLIVTLSLLVSLGVRAQSSDRVVALAVTDVDLPERVNQGEVARIVVAGYLPSGCHHDAHARVERRDARTHVVRTLARKLTDAGVKCLARYDHTFEDVITLKDLEPGEHHLVTLDSEGAWTVRTFTVSR